jgi:hypothetical protein
MPFFPRVLVHLVSFDHGIAQRVAVATQLAGHRRRGLARRDAVEDQHQLRGAAMRPLQEGPGPGVEDATAVTALVVQDRLAVAVVDPQASPLTACRTGQTVGVE